MGGVTLMNILLIILQTINLLVMPLLLLGVVRKVKALMQNRVGAPILQPFYDVAKLLRKSETISYNTSWIFIYAPRISLTTAIIAAVLIPWAGILLPPEWASATNFIFLLYLLSLGKFFVMLSALDAGSAFGGLGASREAVISILVEPSMVISLGALALAAGDMNMSAIYTHPINPVIAGLAAIALLIASLAELSRMPVDDPTTHLELTMVHEAMILENSGRNLAITEYASAIRMCIFWGLSAQTLLLMLPAYIVMPITIKYLIGIVLMMIIGITVAFLEGILVRLKWRRVPNYLAFAGLFSLLAAMVAAVRM
jgi:formate hydrogenlyase subunit 4